jgi:DHA2 family lincomycin resistance protein-like MFS transporter
MTLVPPARRGAVMGNLSIVISVAPAIGPTVSGVVLSFLGWRAVFLVVLPIALVTLWIGLRRMVDVGEPTRSPIDALSVALSVVGFGGLVYGLSAIGAGGAGAMLPTWVPFVVGGLGIAAFVARQLILQRTDRALLDLRTFRSRTFTTASLIMMLMMATLLGSLTLLPIYMQEVLHLSPLATGLLLLPGGLTMGLLGPVVGRLYDRVGARALLLPGTVVTSLALWWSTLFDSTSPAWFVLGFHVLLSVGLALVFTPLFTAGLGAVEPRLYSYGSAIFGTTQQLAGAAGVALLVSVLSVGAAGLTAAGASPVVATAGGVHQAFVVAAVLSVLAIAAAFGMRTPSPAQEPITH